MSKTDYDDTIHAMMKAGDRIDRLTRLFSEQQAEIASLQSQLAECRERDAEIVNLVQEYRDAKDVCDSELAEPPCDEHYSNHMAALNKRDSAATDFAEGVLYLFPPEAA